MIRRADLPSACTSVSFPECVDMDIQTHGKKCVVEDWGGRE